MTDREQRDERIEKYLAGELGQDERRSLEVEMQSDEVLRREVRELSLVRAAMKVADDVRGSHLSEDDMTAYIESRDQISPEALRRVEAHIGRCTTCSDFIEDAVAAWAQVSTATEVRPAPRHATVRHPLIDFIRKLLVDPVPLRPAYGLIALALLAVPVIRALNTPVSSTHVQSFELVESEVRGPGSVNAVELSNGTDVVHFEFALPVRDDRTYEIRLLNSLSNTIISRPDVPPSDVLSLDVPAAYLYAGVFEVHVLERDDAGVLSEDFRLPVRICKPW